MFTRNIFFATLVILLVGCALTSAQSARAQAPVLWTEPRVIPYIDPNGWTPFLLADGNGGIHAFSSQKVGIYEYVIVYNKWTRESGWSRPVDILLSPLFEEAHAPAAYLDQKGMVHVVFYGGHDVRANIYYSRAHISEAQDAAAWLDPIEIATAARPPITVWIEGDADDNLHVLFGGNVEGTGIYATESSDGGDTWRLAELVAATYSDRLWPYALRMHYGESGRLYATWNVLNRRAWGTTLYVTTYDFNTQRWREPVEIAYGEEGGILGVQSPSLVEYQSEIFVMYDNGLPEQGVVRLIRRSSDGGRTWSEAVRPFELVGGNGPAALVVDSNNELRVIFGQRTVGIVKDQIHGMWYSKWHPRTKSWGGVKAIISGPLVQDIDGDKGFDPSAARSVVSQGNLLMTVWRTDPGNGANGAWYSYSELDAPFYPFVPIATPQPVVRPTPILMHSLALSESNESTVQLPVQSVPSVTPSRPEVRQLANPATPLIIGLVPVGLLISFVFYRHNRRRY